MKRNYLIVALRNFWKHKFLSLINIIGLAIGISASLVIYLIVSHDLSYDRFHPGKEQLYRIVSRIDFQDLTIHNSGVPVPTAAAVREEIPGVEAVTHFITANQMKVTVPDGNDKTPRLFRRQENIIFADQYYFGMFQYKWLAGSAVNALSAPFQVVLSDLRAQQYFPGVSIADVIGRQVVYDDSIKATVTGVVESFKENTHFNFGDYLSRATIESTGLKEHWSWSEWGSINSSSQLFVKLAPNTSSARTEQLIAALRDKHRTKRPGDEAKDDTKHFLQPLADLHFNAEYDSFEQRQGNKPTMYGLLAVAGFLLLLACINFINLATAQASTRAKEIGIRKTLGGNRFHIKLQFLSEAFLLTLLATIVSIFLAPALLAVFKDYIPPAITAASINQWHVWLFMLLLVLMVSLLAGYYPAYVLSKLQPVLVMKQQVYSNTGSAGKAWLRKVLTTSQFTIAQFLLIATLVVSKQVHYSLNKELGYKKDAIVFFDLPHNFYSDKPDERRFILFEKLRSVPGIERLSLAGSPPASQNTSTTDMKFRNDDKLVETMVEVKYADSNYFSLYGMKLLAGNNLQQSDTTKEFVINETYAKMLGFKNPSEALGKFIERNHLVPVTGVINDFHTKSTRQAIKPLAYSSAFKNSHTMHMALAGRGSDRSDWSATLSKVEAAFKSLYPEEEFSYKFYDESIASLYKAEQAASGLLKWAAGLCLLISSLGLLGLVIYTTNARTKEIGVRKVLGASITQLVMLLSKDFIALVSLAFLIAVPLSWMVMHNWLMDFAYRTTLSWWLFMLSGAGMLLLAIVTLSIRTIKAAAENPVNSLKTE